MSCENLRFVTVKRYLDLDDEISVNAERTYEAILDDFKRYIAMWMDVAPADVRLSFEPAENVGGTCAEWNVTIKHTDVGELSASDYCDIYTSMYDIAEKAVAHLDVYLTEIRAYGKKVEA